MDRARRRRRGVEGRLLVFCVTPTLVVVPCVINLKRPGCFRGFVTRPCPAREGSPLLIGPVEHAGIRGAGEEALADVDRDAIETAFISFAADKQRHYQTSAGGLATARALAMKRPATGVNVRSLRVMIVTGQRWRSAPFAREPVSCRLEDGFAQPADTRSAPSAAYRSPMLRPSPVPPPVVSTRLDFRRSFSNIIALPSLPIP